MKKTLQDFEKEYIEEMDLATWDIMTMKKAILQAYTFIKEPSSMLNECRAILKDLIERFPAVKETDQIAIAERYAQHRYEEGLKADRWISVKDRLPEPKQFVIGYFPMHRNTCTVHLNDNGTWDVHNKLVFGDMSHWQPLPSPPIKQK